MHLNASSYAKIRNASGFALVVTLIMLVLAAVIVIALLSNASLDRVTAKSTEERYQAQLAAESGLEAAKSALLASPNSATSVTADDTFLIVRVEGTQANPNGAKDSYYFLAKAQVGGATVDCYPLYAGGTASNVPISHTSLPAFQKPVAPIAPFSNAAQTTYGGTPRLYPPLLPFQQPAYTQWQEVRDPNDGAAGPAKLPYQRYTFWIEDLAGYLDASVVGNMNSGGVHARPTGLNPNEVALFTIFEPAQGTDPGATRAKDLIDNRALLFTVPTLTQVAPPAGGKSDVTQPNLAVRAGIDTGGERNLIPFGFGYQDEGKAKTNINTVIANAAITDDAKVTNLAKVISDNRPQFATIRKGGLAATEDYVKTLAANMIGYATGQPIIGTNYKGIGLHPFVVEFFEKFVWERNGSENFYFQDGTWWADVRAVGYVQLWNMTNRDITSGSLTFSDINRYYAYVGGSSEQHKFEDNFGTANIVFDAANSLAANQFKVFKVYDHLYHFNSGLAAKPPTNSTTKVKLGSEASFAADPGTCGYVVKWNGKIVDRAGAGTLDGARDDGTDKFAGLNYSGLERTKATLATPGEGSDPNWRGTLPGLRYELPPPSFGESIYNLGDPRSAYYIQIEQADVSYAAQSAWKGRIYQNGLVTASGWKAAETTVASWPDGGHSTQKGTLPPNTSADPTTLASAPLESGKAPTNMASGGKYSSITELSRIYDPIQWKPAGFPPSSRTDFEQKWKDAWKSNMASDSNYGCASTLHVGSPEFNNFDTDDARAARLLDLLSIADRLDTRGLVNLNTASREALRALAAGIEINGNNVDAAMTPLKVDGPVSDPDAPVQADKFADAVIANRPFLTTSQLAGISTDPNDRTTSFFGNAAQWSANGPTEWNDSAREDYFARTYNLSTVRSRNFRIFVTGQAVDPRIKDAAGNPTVLSTVSRVYQTYLRPTRDAAGKVTAQHAEITYEKDL